MADAAPKSSWERFLDEGGWAAFIISVIVGDATIVGILTALSEGPGQLDLDGVKLFWNVFLVTTPLAIAAVIFFGLAFAGVLSNGYQLLFAGAAALVAGAGIGSALGSTSGISVEQAMAISARSGGTSPSGLTRTIAEFLGAYFLLYGWQYFVAAIVLGVFFGRWAAHVAGRGDVDR